MFVGMMELQERRVHVFQAYCSDKKERLALI